MLSRCRQTGPAQPHREVCCCTRGTPLTELVSSSDGRRTSSGDRTLTRSSAFGCCTTGEALRRANRKERAHVRCNARGCLLPHSPQASRLHLAAGSLFARDWHDFLAIRESDGLEVPRCRQRRKKRQALARTERKYKMTLPDAALALQLRMQPKGMLPTLSRLDRRFQSRFSGETCFGSRRRRKQFHTGGP